MYGGMVMKTNLTTIPVGVSWLVSKLVAHQQKVAKHDADTINNIERLYHLKESGIITQSEYDELKQKLKERI